MRTALRNYESLVLTNWCKISQKELKIVKELERNTKNANKGNGGSKNGLHSRKLENRSIKILENIEFLPKLRPTQSNFLEFISREVLKWNGMSNELYS